jgi:K+-transporting ATPase ATPase C chain
MQEQKTSNPALGHLRANALLLVLSLVICSVLYPAAVWVVGWLFLHDKAEGSLVHQTVDGKDVVIGSTQIAQAFNSPVYFQPRPSAASYNGAASSGSNYAASNPKLRGRVATLLGTICRYSDAYKQSKAYKKSHKPKDDGSWPDPPDDIVAWYKEQTAAKRDLFTEWATNNSTIAQAWATGGWVSGGMWTKDYILQWAKDHPHVVADYKKDNPSATGDPGADALVVYFFKSYEKEFSGKWPTQEGLSDVVKRINADGKNRDDVVKRWKAANPDAKDEPKDADLAAFYYQDQPKNPKDWPLLRPGEWVDADQKALVKPDAQDSDLQGTFFDTWLTEQVKAKKLDPLKDFDQVPADMVTTSGSGLDPDISLANARYQEDGVVAANVKQIVDAFNNDEANRKAGKTADEKKVAAAVKTKVDALLDQMASQPMFGLTGDGPLVNVLKLNLALKAEMAKIPAQ